VEEVDQVLPGPKSGRDISRGVCAGAGVDAACGRKAAGGLRELRRAGVLGELGLEAVPDAGTVGDWLRRQGLAGAEAIQQVSPTPGRGLFAVGKRRK